MTMSFLRWFLPALAVVGAILSLLVATSVLWGWPGPVHLPAGGLPIGDRALSWPMAAVLVGMAVACALAEARPRTE